MPFIEWNDSMSVNIRELDADHKKLISLINKLHDAVEKNSADEVLSEVLYEVFNYTIYHFFGEEDLMIKYHYSGIEEHKEEHIRLTEKTMHFMDAVRNHRTVIDIDVLDFLKNWLSHHILETDKKYVAYLKDKGVN